MRRYTEEELYSMPEEDLIELCNRQLAEQNPNPVDLNPNGHPIENEGTLGKFDAVLWPNMRRPVEETKEVPAPNAAFWSSGAIPSNRRKK